MKIQVRSFRQGLAGAVRPPAPRIDPERSVLGPYLYFFSAPLVLERVKPVPRTASGARVGHEKK